MIRRATLAAIILAASISISSCVSESSNREVVMSEKADGPTPVLSYMPQDIAPGIVVTIDWIDYDIAGDILADQVFVVGTLRNESKVAYRLNPKDVFFEVNDELIYAALAMPHDVDIDPGSDIKVGWQFDRKKDEFKDALLTIGDATWAGDFTELVKRRGPSSSAPPSK